DGPLARRVADLRVACQVLAGPDPRDPRVVPAPLEGPPMPRPLRVAVVADPGGLGVHPHVRSGVEMAAAALQDAGYMLGEVDVPGRAETLEAYGGMIMTEFSLIWPTLERLLSPESRRYIEFSMALRAPVDLAGYLRLTAVRQGLQRDWAQYLARYPLVLGPVFTETAVPAARPGCATAPRPKGRRRPQRRPLRETGHEPPRQAGEA